MSYTARDVKDRVVQFPKRFKLTAVAGEADTYELTAVTGTVTEVGTAINKAYLQPIEDYLGELVRNYTATITTSGWSGSEPPYSKDITVIGIKATDKAIVDLLSTGDYDNDLEVADTWGEIYKISTDTDKITVEFHEIPEVAIPIQIKVVE